MREVLRHVDQLLDDGGMATTVWQRKTSPRIPWRTTHALDEWVAERQKSSQWPHDELFFVRTAGKGMGKVNVAQVKDWKTAQFIAAIRN